MVQLGTDRRRNSPTRSPSRKRRPAVEGLEERLLLFATNGGHWAYPALITYSFMPDGTNVGGVPSTLFQTLNADYPTATWEAAFQKAAAVWEAVANINLAEVSDDGAAAGTANYQQGDPTEGDIRIGAIALSPSQLAMAFYPPPINGGSEAGDIFLNSSQNWSWTGYDLTTVAIHEFGHALGMNHSQITTACMYAYYNGTKQALTTDDVSGIQSVYGAVSADTVNNATWATATDLTGLINGQAQVALGGLSLNGGTDQDWFKVTVPNTTTGSMVVTMQASNLSSLGTKVTVFDSGLHGLATSSNTAYGGNSTVTINGVAPGQVYYIRALAPAIPNVGAYGLLINFGSNYQPPIVPPSTVVYAQPDQGGGSSSLSTAAIPTSSAGEPSWAGQGGTLSAGDDLGTDQIQVGNIVGWGDALSVDAAPSHAPVKGQSSHAVPRGPGGSLSHRGQQGVRPAHPGGGGPSRGGHAPAPAHWNTGSLPALTPGGRRSHRS